MTIIRRTLLSSCLLAVTLLVSAVPARRGLWKTLKLAEGTEVRAELRGDEFCHYWQSADGTRYVSNGDGWTTVSQSATARAGSRRKAQATQMRRTRKATQFNTLRGEKKGIIILAEFADMKFKANHTRELFNDMANKEGFYSTIGFNGSAYDYFKAQSNGQFLLTFDVAGPVQLPGTVAYYGTDVPYDGETEVSEGNDAHAGEMVAQACRAVADSIDFAHYDWDGDGEADQVVVIFAGKGQADGGKAETIWPHEFALQYGDYGQRLHIGTTYVNTYAVVNELQGSGKHSGIGTLCHEFSHCLGLMDMYDTMNNTNFGMGMWSLMDEGSYNGDGFQPAGYTSFEKMSCGWLTPVELTADTVVTDMQPLSQNGEAYLIRNDNWSDEYYLLENRQLTGWDASLPNGGLLVLHVDYDADIWAYNIVNSYDTYYDSHGRRHANDHQRCTIFHADNKSGIYTWADIKGDTYPYRDNDSLTNTSYPAAATYHDNSRGQKLMDRAVTRITQNTDKTMGFVFSIAAVDGNTQPDNAVLLRETFNLCTGTGGNDGLWSGNIANKQFVPDCEGWDYISARGANQCAKFGTSSALGIATTPTFTLDGEATLTFQAAPWGSDGTGLMLITTDNATVEPEDFTLTKSQWTECTATLRGSGSVQVSFVPTKRLFLDEVSIIKKSVSAVRTVTADSRPANIYTIDGRRAGNDWKRLQPGLYIMNGKKIIKTKQ